MLARLTRDLPGFLRNPISFEQAAQIVRQRLGTRSQQFIRMAEQAIYGHPGSPYLRLLRLAGCELGDLKTLVERLGLEAALERLANEGVYVTFEEVKGRREIVRGSQRFGVTFQDFERPGLAAHLEVPTSGSSGRRTPVKKTLQFIADLAPDTALALMAHDLADAEQVYWQRTPLVHMLRHARMGRPPVAWFHPFQPLPLKVQAAAMYFQTYGRLLGCPLPTPSWMRPEQSGSLALWLAKRLAKGGYICLTTYASSAVRLAIAAQERGIELQGLWFVAMGEPVTEAKRRAIESAGARVLVNYGMVDLSTLALLCAEPRGPMICTSSPIAMR